MTEIAATTVIPESVRYAAELYAGFFAAALIDVHGRTSAQYHDAGRDLVSALALGFAAELADTENVRTDSADRPYIIVNPMFSGTVNAAIAAAGLRAQDVPHAIRLFVTPFTVEMSIDTFGIDRQFFSVFPAPGN